MFNTRCRNDNLGAAISVMAVLDYIFATSWKDDVSEESTASLLQLAERTGNESFRTGALTQSLNAKYKDVALQRWVALRLSELTHDKFRDYEQSLENV